MIGRPRPRVTARTRRSALVLITAGCALAATTVGPAASALASPPAPPTGAGRLSSSTVVENWGGYAGPFHKTRARNRIVVVSKPGTTDGKALKLQLDADPGVGPGQGVEIASNDVRHGFGTYGTRMRAADCTGQDRPGVVTGAFTYSFDHSDADLDGLADNDEIDIEFLCAQPDVVWMTLWTDYDEVTDTPRKISRAVNLRTGQVLTTCYRLSWTGACEPLLPGEDSPAAVTPVPGFDSGRQFRSYQFTWQEDRVRFYASADNGRRILLWDYQGPVSRIPQKPSTFMQNVWHTTTWDPLDGPARARPTVDVSAYIDSTTVPR